MIFRFLAIALTVGLAPNLSHSQANNWTPIIVSEQIQRIAVEFPIAERLGINSENPEPFDTARYMGFLAATQVVAQQIAFKTGRETLTDNDFRVALFLQCIWPPNKPPEALVEEFWPDQTSAFYSEKTRSILAEAVGPSAKAIYELVLSSSDPSTDLNAMLSKLETQDQYFLEYFNPSLLRGLK